ncbi:hypothetical protein K458DRAFT_422378 [Lentithecium fluviatile CBS 122367]|uniref:Rhodopsin domain-containing protein n=1 Tax=Lentithecium fluviatile CBS 122367 TaxID=1168545 RepID=A0A6G1IM70_9PLEO|nr:hypothetical protein K458DRAFT_422378 [Lentithecium fluviatile CBS 122367]
MGALNGNTWGAAQIGVFATFQFLILVVCTLRLWTRRISNVELALNDYLILSALFFTSAIGACSVISVVLGGAGRHMNTVNAENILVLNKLFIAGACLWALANTSVKLSMLHLYVTIFPSARFKLFAKAIAGFTLCYCLTILLETFLLCRPFRYNWDKSINGYCANEQLAYLTAGIINLLLDVAIIVLPLPILWKLQMALTKKFGIAFMLSIGVFICVITILRLTSIRRLDFSNFSYTAAEVEIWSILEPYLGIINACIPVMQPAVRRMFRARHPVSRSQTKNSHPSLPTIGGSGGTSKNDKRNFRRLHDVSYELQSIDRTGDEVTTVRQDEPEG